MSDLARFEYGLKWWAQIWYAAWGLLSGGAGVLGMIAAICVREFNSACYWGECLLFIGFLAMGWFFLAYAFRSRLVFDGTRISVRYAMKEKSADLSDIAGYRTVVTKNASFWRIILKHGDFLSINKVFAVDNAFKDFLVHLKEVDEDAPVSLGLCG